ncbi:glycoside hydrolase family 3 C-terminal domain-containing protein [Streptomyces sp. Li-HN-5-11]|uniref:beta-glucosidase n=1 Tax=Streptomyces sp. Li-HN-5-11 TaxID=3075432 RepID=UPI0028A7E884|nr:glycoside hydrolase family 3 C-terminal domain-containing protein [Streptomyces sp. Li-HN-5-11]WNM31887.1 glycoside hydrolase family 3 C-terminal domain-containing protein [Streptomyces sp. Li-HN-5-11]
MLITVSGVAVLGVAPAGFSGQPAASAPDRLSQLVAGMTLDEKLSFVQGRWDDPRQQVIGENGYIPGVPRLGIPPLRTTDGPAGTRAAPSSTAMPVPVALASSFDDGLAREFGRVLGRDGRARGMDVVLAPMVNTIRVPYAGRNFESYSEDPLVNSRMVGQEVRGIQDEGLIATTKHFAANNQETDRQSIDVNVGEQALHEVELSGFEAAVKAGTGSVMCSYNKVNGAHSCSNDTLLTSILREQWGFGGWVMSDWNATRATTDILRGLDQDMPGPPLVPDYFGAPLKAAIQDGSIPVTALDRSVTRILGTMRRFGLLRCASPRGPVPGCSLPARPRFDAAASNAVAQRVAEDGAVLLRNKGNALPLTRGAARDIALIGTPAVAPVIGGRGSSEVNPTTVTVPREEIVRRAGPGSAVSCHPGVDTIGTVIPGSALSGGAIDHTGDDALTTRTYDQTRTLTAPEDGDYLINIRSTLSNRTLTVDGKQVADGHSYRNDTLTSTSARVRLTAGTHKIGVRVEGYHDDAKLQVQLTWTPPQAARANLAAAVLAAKKARTAVVFVYDEQTEGADRTTLALPYDQDALVSAVAKANRNTIVVLNTGGPVTMPWLSSVRSVLEMHYPGQMGGAATARLLFGDAVPGGRLTETFPLDDAHTIVSGLPRRYPGVDGQEDYSEGVFTGHRWYDQKKTKTLFPFGFGLSYTTFSYSDLKVTPRPEGLRVSFTVKNTGERAGTEVPQIYLGASSAVRNAQQPVRKLAGYQKVRLGPDESRRVTITVAERQLQYWDSAADGWVTGAGFRDVWVGSSSRDLPLHRTVALSR